MENKFREIGATTYLAPIPAVVLSCQGKEGKPNLITVGWTGVVNSHPPMISVSIRKERYSYSLIRETGEFVLNLVSQDWCRAMDFCGVKSGREVDKFSACGLTPVPAPGMRTPGVGEAPVFLCCRVEQVLELGSHDLFLSQVEQVCVQDRFFRPDGSIDEAAMHLVAYVHGQYYPLDKPMGFFGYSLASPEVLKRRGF